MNSKILSIAILGLILSIPVNSASIYRCTKADKTIIFTDKTCPANTTITLIHKETEQEIQKRQQAEKLETLKKLIEGNQPNAAKEFAAKNNLSDQYFNLLGSYSSQKIQEENQQKEAEKQQQLAIEQQKLALQRQQLAAEKAKTESAQQPQNNQIYFPYYGTTYRKPYHAPNNQPKNSVSGMNPILSGGMNPVSSGGMNPPMSFPSSPPPVVPHPHQKYDRHEQDRRK